MDIIHVNQSNSAYPAALNLHLGKDAPSSIAVLGNLDILNRNKLALLCSVTFPSTLILQTHDLAQQLMQAGITVISGFHSPLERECLTILLRGSQSVVICPARGFTKMRIRTELKKPLEAGRLLFLSPFAHHRHRSDVKMTLYRNRFVAALADQIFVPYAASGSKTEQLCINIIAWGKSLYTVSSDENSNVIALGARPMSPDQVFQLQMPG